MKPQIFIQKGRLLISVPVKAVDVVQTEQEFNIHPNAGGFGQDKSEIALHNPVRIVGQLAFCFFTRLSHNLSVLKTTTI